MSDDIDDIEVLRGRIRALEAENAALRTEADDLDRQLTELEAELEALADEAAVMEWQLDEAEVQSRGSDEERVYLGSKTRRHFHRPGCEWAKCIPDYKLVEFASHAEAVAAGYRPCKTCRA